MVEQKSQKGADGIIMKRNIPLILYRKSKKTNNQNRAK